MTTSSTAAKHTFSTGTILSVCLETGSPLSRVFVSMRRTSSEGLIFRVASHFMRTNTHAFRSRLTCLNLSALAKSAASSPPLSLSSASSAASLSLASLLSSATFSDCAAAAAAASSGKIDSYVSLRLRTVSRQEYLSLPASEVTMYPIASYGMVANVLGCKQEEGSAGDVRGRRPDFVSFRERDFAAAGANESAAVDGRRTHPAVESFLVLLSAAAVVGALFASHGVRNQSVGACGTGQLRTRRRWFSQTTRGVTIQAVSRFHCYLGVCGVGFLR